MRSTSDTIAAIGFAIGGALGIAGMFVAGDALRETLRTIDGVGIVVGTALLTMKCQRLGDNCVSVGYGPRSSHNERSYAAARAVIIA